MDFWSYYAGALEGELERVRADREIQQLKFQARDALAEKQDVLDRLLEAYASCDLEKHALWRTFQDFLEAVRGMVPPEQQADFDCLVRAAVPTEAFYRLLGPQALSVDEVRPAWQDTRFYAYQRAMVQAKDSPERRLLLGGKGRMELHWTGAFGGEKAPKAEQLTQLGQTLLEAAAALKNGQRPAQAPAACAAAKAREEDYIVMDDGYGNVLRKIPRKPAPAPETPATAEEEDYITMDDGYGKVVRKIPRKPNPEPHSEG